VRGYGRQLRPRYPAARLIKTRLFGTCGPLLAAVGLRRARGWGWGTFEKAVKTRLVRGPRLRDWTGALFVGRRGL